MCDEAGGLPRFARNKRRRWAFLDGLLAFGKLAGKALALQRPCLSFRALLGEETTDKDSGEGLAAARGVFLRVVEDVLLVQPLRQFTGLLRRDVLLVRLTSQSPLPMSS